MTTLPNEIDALRGHEVLEETLELQWLDPGEREFMRTDWLDVWSQIPYDDAFHEECAARLERCIPLATGVTRERRLSGTASQLALIFDPHHPDAVFLSLSHAMPSRLWLRMRADADAILEATAPYLVEAGPINDLSKTLRLGKVVGVDDLDTIENALLGFELWLDDASWGSDFNDDPWLNAKRPLSMIDQTIWLRDTAAQHPERFGSKSFRTLWSTSVLTVEQHAFGAWVFELRYNPASESEAVSYVNEVTQSRLPLDLPIDIAVSLLRGQNIGHEVLADLAVRGEALSDRLVITCAIANGEPTTVEMLRDAMLANPDDEDVLGCVADLAAGYGHYGVLFELASRTAGTELGDNLYNFLNPMPQAAP